MTNSSYKPVQQLCSLRKSPINKHLQIAISNAISNAQGQPFDISSIKPTAGGCINTTYIIENGQQCFFVKTNRRDMLPMFEAESQALLEIASTSTMRVPIPVCSGRDNSDAWLVMENLQLQKHGDQHQLGDQLAAMHSITSSQFGWLRDNTIGSTAQINTRSDNWLEFFREQRLGFQLSLAARNGYTGSLQAAGAALLENLADFFVDHQPAASLLHGDLWGGNYAFTTSGEPVLFDPALYYGDRETDIAMTELFGGFSREFRSSYESSWPLSEGYPVRRHLYNCYHILNHLNLFGGGYLSQAESMMQSLLSERNG